jgi:hypothetical protein
VTIRGEPRYCRGSKLQPVEQAWRAPKAVVANFYKSRGGFLDAVVAFFWRPWRPWLASLGGRYIHICMAGLCGRLELRASCLYDRLELRASCFLCVAGVAYRYVGQDLCGRLKLRSKQFCIVGCDSTVGRRNRPTMELCLQAKVEEGGLSLRGGAWP